MSILATATASMIIATLSVHLGLFDAVLSVFKKIASCSQCATFWGTLTALSVLCDGGIVVDVVLSIIAAYVSNRFVLLLMCAQYKYEKLWQKIKRLK